MAQQQQYVQYTAQPVGPGATMYTYPDAQQPRAMVVQPGVANATVVQNKFDPSGSRAAVVLASIQFTIGCCCIGFQSIATHLESSVTRPNTAEFLGAGIWCGILFLVTGALGLGAGKRNSPGLIIAFMVMNIICTLAVWTLLGFAAMNLVLLQECRQQGSSPYHLMYSIRMYCDGTLYSAWIAMDAFLVTLALFEFIIAVTSAAYCCKAVCYCCRSNPGMILQQPQSGVYVATTVQLPSQQQQPPQAMGAKPYPVQGSYAQYPAGGVPGAVSYGQTPYAQPGQPPYQQQQQAAYPQGAYPQGAYPQAAYSPYATSSAIPGAAGQSGAAFPGQASYPPTAGDSKPVASAPELPPAYDTALKL